MISTFDSMVTFPVTRAEAYPHDPPDDFGPDAPILDLGIEHFVVDASVVVGMVTLAASTTKSAIDAYGQEFDLAPADARRLGLQLIAAATDSDGGDPAPFFLAHVEDSANDEETDDEVIQIVTTGVEEEDDGSVSVWLTSEDPTWPPETGLRLTEHDALALRDGLSQAVQLVSEAKPQRFIRLLISNPPSDVSGLVSLGFQQIEVNK